MMELPTDPDGFPEGTDLEERDCRDCGTTGYVPANEPHRRHPNQCQECARADFREYLDPDTETSIDRLDALDRIRSRGYLPMRDPVDGALITAVKVDRGPPGSGSYLKKLTRVVERECPNCGHDRADETQWNHFTCESGYHVDCRVCGHTIEERSTL